MQCLRSHYQRAQWQLELTWTADWVIASHITRACMSCWSFASESDMCENIFGFRMWLRWKKINVYCTYDTCNKNWYHQHLLEIWALLTHMSIYAFTELRIQLYRLTENNPVFTAEFSIACRFWCFFVVHCEQFAPHMNFNSHGRSLSWIIFEIKSSSCTWNAIRTLLIGLNGMTELCTASLQKIQACNRAMIIRLWGALRGRRDFICPEFTFCVSLMTLTHSLMVAWHCRVCVCTCRRQWWCLSCNQPLLIDDQL